MTDLDPDNDRYWDGWTDATLDLRHRLTTTGNVCIDCSLDQTTFAGIAAAAAGHASISAERNLLTATAIELLVKTAAADRPEDQAEIMGLARTLVTDTPDVAERVLVQLALMYERRL